MGAEHIPTATQAPIKQKSLCNPLLPSQEKAWKDPECWDLSFGCRKPVAGIGTIQSSQFPLFNMFSQTKTPWQRLGGH